MSTDFPDECPSSHSDTGYLVALVIVIVLCFILLGYITFIKFGHLNLSQLKRTSCKTKFDKMINKKGNSDTGKCTEDKLLTGVTVLTKLIIVCSILYNTSYWLEVMNLLRTHIIIMAQL